MMTTEERRLRTRAMAEHDQRWELLKAILSRMETDDRVELVRRVLDVDVLRAMDDDELGMVGLMAMQAMVEAWERALVEEEAET
jgi:hypothetical protein